MKTFSATILLLLIALTAFTPPAYAVGKFYKYLEKANAGDPIAQHAVALCYERGDGIRHDYRKARYWYEKAIENGYSPSMVRLGWLYQDGVKYIRRNVDKALEYYEMGADLGEVQAMVNMAVIYDQGLLVPEDDAMASKWYHPAAKAGHPVALFNLGVNYWQGEGIGKDYREAWRLLNELRTSEKAEEKDKEQARLALDQIKEELGITSSEYPSWEELEFKDGPPPVVAAE